MCAHNALIKLDEADSAGKGRKFKSRFITPGLAGYPDQFGNVLIQKETFDKFINSMVGVPVVIRHKDLTQNNADDERVGVVSTVWFDEKDGWYWCEGIIWNETAINLILDKGWSVSCSYDVLEADDSGGTWNNTPYDMEFLNGVFTHLALVDNPRYEKANIVFNSKTILNNKFKEEEHPRDEDGKFTSGGKGGKSFKDQIRDIESGNISDKTLLNVSDKPSQVWKDSGLPDKPLVMSAGVYKKATETKHQVDKETIEKLPELIQDPLYIFKSSTQQGSFVGVLDAVENKEKADGPLIVAIKPSQKGLEVNIITSTYGKDKNFIERELNKGNLLYENKKTGVSNRKASIALKVNNLSENIITNSLQDFNSKSTNIKEHEDMTLIEEIKKLIYKAENEKGDCMKKARNEDVDKREILREADAIAMKSASDFKGGEEEKFATLTKKLEELSYNKSDRGTSDNEKEDDDDTKADNEKTDKRKLIDEVGGILKGKVDDEIIRTVMKKMEEASYNPSEREKADNESQTSEEEYKDFKKEIKEEADNKKSCKNKVNNAKTSYFDELNRIYNAPQKETKVNLLVTKAKRLEAGNKY